MMARLRIEPMDFEPLEAALESANLMLESRAWPPHLAERWARMENRFEIADVEWVRGRWLVVPSDALERLLRALANCPRKVPGAAAPVRRSPEGEGG